MPGMPCVPRPFMAGLASTRALCVLTPTPLKGAWNPVAAARVRARDSIALAGAHDVTRLRGDLLPGNCLHFPSVGEVVSYSVFYSRTLTLTPPRARKRHAAVKASALGYLVGVMVCSVCLGGCVVRGLLRLFIAPRIGETKNKNTLTQLDIYTWRRPTQWRRPTPRNQSRLRAPLLLRCPPERPNELLRPSPPSSTQRNLWQAMWPNCWAACRQAFTRCVHPNNIRSPSHIFQNVCSLPNHRLAHRARIAFLPILSSPTTRWTT